MDEEQRYKQYLLEKELANTIREASPEDRQRVIKESYSRLYSEITWHSGLNATEQDRREINLFKHNAFGWALGNNRDVLEIGCGTGEFLASLASRQKSCVGLEIAELKAEQFPEAGGNLLFKVMEGMRFPSIEDSRFDVVFTSQVLEHFHPDDVPTHLEEVYRVLRPGGAYVLDTPTGINGPHDISRDFDKVATGMHLKEWTYAEITPIFRKAGFKRLRVQVVPQRFLSRWLWMARFGLWSAGWKVFLENLVRKVPDGRLRTRLIGIFTLYTLLLIAEK